MTNFNSHYIFLMYVHFHIYKSIIIITHPYRAIIEVEVPNFSG